MELDHVFWKFENKIFLNCEQYGKNQYKKKERNQQSSVFKVLDNFHIIQTS